LAFSAPLQILANYFLPVNWALVRKVMHNPHIGIVFEQNLPDSIFKSFETDVKADGLNVFIESREPFGPMACAEWYIMPAVAAFVGVSYFSGFLKEAGKDHYLLLKERLSNLTNVVMKTPRIEPSVFATEGKINANNPFSLAFAIHADTEDGFTFKLLMPKAKTNSDYELITSKFLDFLNDYHLGIKSLDTIGFIRDINLPAPTMIFIHYNSDSNSIEWLDEKTYR
jgi:hypothetical protein